MLRSGSSSIFGFTLFTPSPRATCFAVLGISWVMSLNAPLTTLFGFAVTGRSLILLVGGLFLVAKATLEIFEKTLLDYLWLESPEARFEANKQKYGTRIAEAIRNNWIRSVWIIYAAISIALILSVLAFRALVERRLKSLLVATRVIGAGNLEYEGARAVVAQDELEARGGTGGGWGRGRGPSTSRLGFRRGRGACPEPVEGLRANGRRYRMPGFPCFQRSNSVVRRSTCSRSSAASSL